MESSVNLQAYLERIGYQGNPTASIETLRILHARHPQAIPFENISPLLGQPVKLDHESLEQKMIHNRRGGYCFEHNLLFHDVLQQIGFNVWGLAARVRWNKSEDEITPKGHMLLLVTIGDTKYIADVGFGGSTLSAPLLLEPGLVQQTPHEPYRLLTKDNGYLLQIMLGAEWKALYQFTLQEHYRPDYELTSWYLSNHPKSHFINSLKAARTAPGRRYVLSNHTFKVHHREGETEEKSLTSAREINQVLQDHFLLDLPNISHLTDRLEKLISFENTQS